jgi:hypothetical protein
MGRGARRFGWLDVPPGCGKLLYHQLLGLLRATRLRTVFRQHVF